METIAHIQQTMEKNKTKTWCGMDAKNKWCFVSVDHAVYNRINEGRIIACKRCLKAVMKILEIEKEL